MVDDPELLDLVELRSARASDPLPIPRRHDPFVRGSALCALEDREPKMGRESIFELMNAVDANIPQPDRPIDKPS